jgi:hypothetical protein
MARHAPGGEGEPQMILLALIIGLTPYPSPDWLPGQDAVVWSRYGEDDAQTLDGTHCTVVNLGRDYRGWWYDVTCQGWGDERRYRDNMVTRKEWESMSREFIKERRYPSWWMPLYRDLE